ncbi:MAG: DNA alkylation repair protein [Firmicutes bacterium]|jgi:3-methyladenine DNA glycosylase AlkD|nr:DNA alkylation repair protein [Bacillota bacterium]
MNWVQQVRDELAKFTDEERAKTSMRYFQAFPGGYGEGDHFIGVRVPDQRKVARKYYREMPLAAVEQLLKDPIHEYRFTSLIILTHKFEKAKTSEDRQEIVELYLRNSAYVNNWDLVDASADKILGAYLFHGDRSLLYELAESGDLWSQRIAMIATFHFIKQNDFKDALKIATLLLEHDHDLIHKAVGWMLREIGERDYTVEYEFLEKHYRDMPRTMLRYAIEKFDPEVRSKLLKGAI